MDKELKFYIFSYIQEYDKLVSNFGNFECDDIGDSYLAKYQYITQLENPFIGLQDTSCKVSKIALEKWIERKKDQDIIDNGITNL